MSLPVNNKKGANKSQKSQAASGSNSKFIKANSKPAKAADLKRKLILIFSKKQAI